MRDRPPWLLPEEPEPIPRDLWVIVGAVAIAGLAILAALAAAKLCGGL